ncbi:MAG: hypothetical protein IPJ19_09210 [Planctomycetes bacterium]|nr:hypothetical protein [Planctomycetota bacterium]
MLGLLLTFALQLAPGFTEDMRQAARDLSPAYQGRASFLAVGDVESAEKVYLDALPPERVTAAHHYQMANAFVEEDPQFARVHFEKAFELAPDEPQILSAWAAQLHRAGRCESADEIYQRIVSGDWLARVQRVDCLVRLGRLSEAVEAWQWVSTNTPSLSKVFRAVPERIAAGEPRKQVRARLRRALAGGATQSIEELAFLDLVIENSSRRFEVDRLELEIDRQLIAAHLDPQSRRSRELWVVCDFWSALWERGFPAANEGEFPELFRPRMRELGWLEAGGDVPVHPLVARWATRALLESGLRKPGELLADWERALAARLEEGDAGAGDALLEIQRAAESPECARTEELLWSRAHELDAALALLDRRSGHVESGDALLRDALARFPNSAALCAVASECARREGKGESEALVREIAAGFQPPGAPELVDSAMTRLAVLLLAVRDR